MTTPSAEHLLHRIEREVYIWITNTGVMQDLVSESDRTGSLGSQPRTSGSFKAVLSFNFINCFSEKMLDNVWLCLSTNPSLTISLGEKVGLNLGWFYITPIGVVSLHYE